MKKKRTRSHNKRVEEQIDRDFTDGTDIRHGRDGLARLAEAIQLKDATLEEKIEEASKPLYIKRYE